MVAREVTLTVFRDGTELHRYIDLDVVGNFQDDAGLGVGLETVRGHFELVRSNGFGSS